MLPHGNRIASPSAATATRRSLIPHGFPFVHRTPFTDAYATSSLHTNRSALPHQAIHRTTTLSCPHRALQILPSLTIRTYVLYDRKRHTRRGCGPGQRPTAPGSGSQPSSRPQRALPADVPPGRAPVTPLPDPPTRAGWSSSDRRTTRPSTAQRRTPNAERRCILQPVFNRLPSLSPGLRVPGGSGHGATSGKHSPPSPSTPFV